MKIQPNKSKIGIFLSICILSKASLSFTPIFIVELVERPLTIYSFPMQKAHANSNFNFNFSPYISKVQTEIDYKVTNNSARVLTELGLYQLQGVTQIYDGEGVCDYRFTLNPGQSCILRLIINKAQYIHSIYGGPIVCYHPPQGFCYRPEARAHQLDLLVDGLPGKTTVKVSPTPRDGLYFNPDTLTISGTPNMAVEYNFSISATNGVSTAVSRPLQIKVNIDPKDTPVFKTNYSISTAMPEQEYRINLMDLLEPNKSYMVTNQISFEIDPNQSHPTWLRIDPNNPTILKGKVSVDDAGQMKAVTLIARSNTGGPSSPLTIQIPVAYDPTKKPIIAKNLMLAAKVGDTINNDFRPNITDPTTDGNLKIIIDKIEPETSWLKVSNTNPTELEGTVPDDAIGQSYLITLTASTPKGGASAKEIIPLNIATNPERIPRFYADNPNLPLLYEGQPYSYDFVANNDIYPDYTDSPYTVYLPQGHTNPSWVRIENNKLIVDKVPEHLEQMEQVFIEIKNIPGGKSEVLTLKLYIMN